MVEQLLKLGFSVAIESGAVNWQVLTTKRLAVQAGDTYAMLFRAGNISSAFQQMLFIEPRNYAGQVLSGLRKIPG